MQWLTPLIGLYAAAIAVPLLLLLYFLKLKRREELISSTLLWKRAVQDLRVNAPFQHLRRNILLILQLLMLTAILLALAGPVLSLNAGPGRRYVILIDRSASMNAADVEPSRLKAAQKQAKTFVQSLREKAAFSLRDTSDLAMVIAFDAHPKVLCNFTADKPQLLSAIDAIECTDGQSLLAETAMVARAFAQAPAAEGNIRSAETPAQLILFSDGQIQDLDKIVVASDELVFHCMGQSADNVAVTTAKARRSYENPEEVEVLATLANFCPNSVTTDVQLSVDENVRAVRTVTIPPCTQTDQRNRPSEPGLVTLNFSLQQAAGGAVEVRHLHKDHLPFDDAAWSILQPPKDLAILLVTAGNPVLESALKACGVTRLDPCTPAGFAAMDHAAMTIKRPYDLIVLDNCTAKDLPRCNYLVFGAPPPDVNVAVTGTLENQLIADWRPRHPVLHSVNLAGLFVAKAYALSVPRDAEVLAEFGASPALAMLRRNASTFLLVGFDLLESNWPFEPSFVLFCYNAVALLACQEGAGQQADLKVMEPIILEGLEPGTPADFDGPYLAAKLTLMANPAGVIRFPGTELVGVYRVTTADQATRLYAVNLAESRESRIEPVREIRLSGTQVEAEQRPVARANVPLWPILVIAALVIACVEWLVYNLKVGI